MAQAKTRVFSRIPSRLVDCVSLITVLLLAGGSVRAQRFTSQETGVFDALNQFRAKPSAFVRTLETIRSDYRGNLFTPPGHVPIQTQEGIRAVDEAIRVLRPLSKPLGTLTLSPGLSKAAALHVRDTGAGGLVGHTGPNGDTLQDRIGRFGTWSQSIAEAISYGDTDPTGVIAQLLIDDGVRDRGHRATLLDPRWRYVGISCGAHAVYGRMCVLDFAVQYEER